jgi:hypothetical protein
MWCDIKYAAVNLSIAGAIVSYDIFDNWNFDSSAVARWTV